MSAQRWFRDVTFEKVCFYCGNETPQEERSRDHILPKQVFPTTQNNIVMACKQCNKLKANHPILRLKVLYRKKADWYEDVIKRCCFKLGMTREVFMTYQHGLHMPIASHSARRRRMARKAREGRKQAIAQGTTRWATMDMADIEYWRLLKEPCPGSSDGRAPDL